MKQKIVIKVQMKGEKCRAKVLKTVAEAYGVISMAIDGPDKDRVVVIGIGVDAVNLTKSLRKKMGYATIVSVQEAKDTAKDKDGYAHLQLHQVTIIHFHSTARTL